MDTLEKLQTVAPHMSLEPAEETGKGDRHVAPCGASLSPRARKQKLSIHHAVMPNGRTIPLLKTLLTSACERNCFYCPFRAGRNYRRVTFRPEELAGIFMEMYRAGLVEGLFVSSGLIGGGVKTQDKLLETAEILRQKQQFNGYMHLKLMPGAETDQIRRAMTLADRLSVNLEAPNDHRLAELAPRKQFMDELLRPLQEIERIRQTEPGRQGWNGRWPSTTTQFVVGGVDETDLELLQTAAYLHQRLNLRRVYYSSFRPISDTPLAERAASDPRREHRLYQASFLFRDYAFDLEEMPFNQSGNLPLDTDPKLAWAAVNLRDNPVEVNAAGREELLRVPGIGPKGAAAILRARRRGKLRRVRELQQIGVQTNRLRPYVLLDGKRPTYQLPLFDAKREA